MNILIVEDVTLISERIKRLTKEYLGNSVSKITISHTLDDARYSIQEERYDLVFLDLNLNGESGFDLLNEAISKSFKIIVITANKSEASKAFDLGIFDFISKPITKDRFKIAIARLKLSDKQFLIESISIKSKGEIKLVNLSDILYIKADGHYSELVCKNGSTHLYEGNMEKIMTLLPSSFHRVHRSYCLDINLIKKYITRGAGKYEAELSESNVIPINKTFYLSFKK